MTNKLNKPYKEIGSSGEKVVSILAFGLFIFLFLFLFKPFGIAQIEPVVQLFITMGFGLVTIFMLFVLKFLIEPVITKRNWTLGKSIIWVIVIASSIGVANYFYIILIFHQPFVFKFLLYSVWTAWLVGCIPVIMSYVINYNKMYRAVLKESTIPATEINWDSEIVIRAGNPRNDVKLNPKNIIYLCSNDNYVTIVTNKGGETSKIHLRGTLKSVESELRRYDQFFRCHKCFIVNGIYVAHLTGNAQNMKIKLSTGGSEIPVSRSRVSIAVKKFK